MAIDVSVNRNRRIVAGNFDPMSAIVRWEAVVKVVVFDARQGWNGAHYRKLAARFGAQHSPASSMATDPLVSAQWLQRIAVRQ